MAADVSSLVRILTRYKDDQTVTLMTRDLLGNGGGEGGRGEGDDHDQSLELDLDLQVPHGWEKRLDLETGKVYLKQQCNTKNSSSTTHHHHHADQSNLFDYTSLELKLVPSSFSHPPPSSSSFSSSSSSNPSLSSRSVSSANSSFQSVCTLEKVKSALERAEKDIKKRQTPDDGVCDRATASPVAAGCPGCLTYVLVSKNNPKCPRCHLFVPLPAMKKPKIDLNISIL